MLYAINNINCIIKLTSKFFNINIFYNSDYNKYKSIECTVYITASLL